MKAELEQLQQEIDVLDRLGATLRSTNFGTTLEIEVIDRVLARLKQLEYESVRKLRESKGQDV